MNKIEKLDANTIQARIAVRKINELIDAVHMLVSKMENIEKPKTYKQLLAEDSIFAKNAQSEKYVNNCGNPKNKLKAKRKELYTQNMLNKRTKFDGIDDCVNIKPNQ